jgi:hypothetical protein
MVCVLRQWWCAGDRYGDYDGEGWDEGEGGSECAKHM